MNNRSRTKDIDMGQSRHELASDIPIVPEHPHSGNILPRLSGLYFLSIPDPYFVSCRCPNINSYRYKCK